MDYLGASGGVLSYNLFTYCENNPVNNVDGDGRVSGPVVGAFVGAVIGLFGGYFLSQKIIQWLNIKSKTVQTIITVLLTATIGVTCAYIGYKLAPYVSCAWNYCKARLSGLLQGKFKTIDLRKFANQQKLNHIVYNKTHDHMWYKVMNNINFTNVKNLIFKTIAEGTWGYEGGSFVSYLNYKSHVIRVSFNIINGVFLLGDAWVVK